MHGNSALLDLVGEPDESAEFSHGGHVGVVAAAPERGDTFPPDLDLDDHFGVRVEASGGEATVYRNANKREEDLSATKPSVEETVKKE